MVDGFEVVTLCGSSKFKKEFIEVAERLTLEGKIVISLGLFGHADNKFGDIITDEVKEMLDNAHMAKIKMSDSIYVINVDGYIGESTGNEIEYAKSLGKKIYYHKPIIYRYRGWCHSLSELNNVVHNKLFDVYHGDVFIVRDGGRGVRDENGELIRDMQFYMYDGNLNRWVHVDLTDSTIISPTNTDEFNIGVNGTTQPIETGYKTDKIL